MPGCVLHVSGEDFQVAAFLAESSLRPYRIHHSGESARRSRRHRDSGLSLDVSNAEGDLKAEIADAITSSCYTKQSCGGCTIFQASRTCVLISVTTPVM